MKIQFTRAWDRYSKGQIVDWPDGMANCAVDCHRAVRVEEKAEKVKPKKVVAKK